MRHWTRILAQAFYEREQWHNERTRLLARIEERKWIDMAKGILCKMNNISESEAYDVLRKQAMNERKEWWMSQPRSSSCINSWETGSGGAKIMIHLLKKSVAASGRA